MLGRCVDGKEGFVMKESGWLTSSKEIADVLRAGDSWKHDHRHVHVISRSEIATEYATSHVAVFQAHSRKGSRLAAPDLRYLLFVDYEACDLATIYCWLLRDESLENLDARL